MAYRVVQWATGYVGACALKAIIESPDLELAGVLVCNPAKDGKDAGELVGLGPTGVRATTKKEEIFELDADVVIHCPRGLGPMDQHDEDVIALLRSGKNVISTVGYGSPALHGAEYAQKFQAACHAGGATLFGSGVDPDFALSRMPAALTGMCMDVKHIYIAEITDLARDPHQIVVEVLGVGKRPEELSLDHPGVEYLMWYGPEVVDLLARNLTITLDKLNQEFEIFTATRDFRIPAAEVFEGSVVGGRFTWKGYWNGEPFIHLDWIVSVQRDHPAFPDIPYDSRFVIEIEGTPSVRTVMDLNPSLAPDADSKATDVQAAMHAAAAVTIRAIPAVCAAPPGLLEVPIFGAWSPARMS